MADRAQSPAAAVTVTALRPAIAAVVAVPPAADAAAALAAAGLPGPAGPTAVRASDLLVLGKAPGAWTVVADGVEPEALLARLAGLLGETALVGDQSDAWSVFALAGPAARDLLMRGAGIDLHPRAFAAGAAATTPIAGIDAMLWTEDGITIRVAVPASTEASFVHWMDETIPGLG